MKRFLLTTFAVLGLAGSFSAQQVQEDIQTAELGAVLPMADVVMDNANGESTSINGAKGKNGVVVIFSCNTCPFVVGGESFGGWEKTYNDVAAKAKALGYKVILVNSNEAKREGDDSFEKMKERAAAQGYTMPYVVDVDSKLANALGAKTTPHVFVFSADNKLVYTGMIDNSVDNKRKTEIAYLIDALTELSAGKTITTATTPPRGCSIKRKK